MNNNRGLTLLELLAILAVVVLLLVLLFTLCNRGGPLTAADGRIIGGQIHGQLLDLIATSTTPVEEIVEEIRTQILAQADEVKKQKGASDFITGLCAELRMLIQNRIRSTPDAGERRRLQEFLRELDGLCQEALDRATEGG